MDHHTFLLDNRIFKKINNFDTEKERKCTSHENMKISFPVVIFLFLFHYKME